MAAGISATDLKNAYTRFKAALEGDLDGDPKHAVAGYGTYLASLDKARGQLAEASPDVNRLHDEVTTLEQKVQEQYEQHIGKPLADAKADAAKVERETRELREAAASYLTDVTVPELPEMSVVAASADIAAAEADRKAAADALTKAADGSEVGAGSLPDFGNVRTKAEALFAKEKSLLAAQQEKVSESLAAAKNQQTQYQELLMAAKVEQAKQDASRIKGTSAAMSFKAEQKRLAETFLQMQAAGSSDPALRKKCEQHWSNCQQYLKAHVDEEKDLATAAGNAARGYSQGAMGQAIGGEMKVTYNSQGEVEGINLVLPHGDWNDVFLSGGFKGPLGMLMMASGLGSVVSLASFAFRLVAASVALIAAALTLMTGNVKGATEAVNTAKMLIVFGATAAKLAAAAKTVPGVSALVGIDGRITMYRQDIGKDGKPHGPKYKLRKNDMDAIHKALQSGKTATWTDFIRARGDRSATGRVGGIKMSENGSPAVPDSVKVGAKDHVVDDAQSELPDQAKQKLIQRVRDGQVKTVYDKGSEMLVFTDTRGKALGSADAKKVLEHEHTSLPGPEVPDADRSGPYGQLGQAEFWCLNRQGGLIRYVKEPLGEQSQHPFEDGTLAELLSKDGVVIQAPGLSSKVPSAADRDLDSDPTALVQS